MKPRLFSFVENMKPSKIHIFFSKIMHIYYIGWIVLLVECKLMYKIRIFADHNFINKKKNNQSF